MSLSPICLLNTDVDKETLERFQRPVLSQDVQSELQGWWQRLYWDRRLPETTALRNSIIVTTTSLIISCGARDGFIKETKFGDVIKIRNPRKKRSMEKEKRDQMNKFFKIQWQVDSRWTVLEIQEDYYHGSLLSWKPTCEMKLSRGKTCEMKLSGGIFCLPWILPSKTSDWRLMASGRVLLKYIGVQTYDELKDEFCWDTSWCWPMASWRMRLLR